MNINTDHAIESPASEHICQLCQKAFQRKDLRDRHARRCSNTWGKPRKSKRRSCVNCVRMKLRCSLDAPSCTRCVDRGTICDYGSRSISNSHRRIESSSSHLDLPNLNPTASPSAMVQYVHDSADAIVSFNAEDPSLLVQDHFTNGFDMSLPARAEIQTDLFKCLEAPQGHDDSALEHAYKTPSISDSNFSYPLPFQDETSIPSVRNASLNGADFLPKNYRNLMTYGMGISRLPQHPTVQHLIEYTRNIPRQMLDVEYWPPFVHSRLYRCSDGGVAEPLAVALCCLSAKYSGFQSTAKFIGDLEAKERVRLVEQFHELSSLKSSLASIHGMCLHQIAGLLDERREVNSDSKFSSAQLYQPYLLKMTRKLCQRNIPMLESDDKSSSDSWKNWQQAETLRRTVHLVNIINKLSCYMTKTSAQFYESLGDELILDLPLPVPDALWRARSFQELQLARTRIEHKSWGNSTPRKVLESPDAMDLVGLGAASGLQPDSSVELSRLIMECIKLDPHD